ncbi:MAG: serine hydrolase domain-containing protein [Sphingobacterium sp.]
MKLTINFLGFFFSTLLLSSGVYGQRIDDYSSKIDSLIQTANPRTFNGVILITENGKTKYAKAFGYSNMERKVPISLEDNFRIQSNSKQITAVLILKEVEKGNISLDKPIGTYLTDLKQQWADTVTVHQLLNMSAGIVSLDKPLAFKPGTGFYYSNPAYGLLGRLIESTTGRKYVDVANSLFKELKMKNTYCYEIGKTIPGLINGYVRSKDSISLVDFKTLNFTNEFWSNFIPTGGIISNVTDLNLWDTKLHNGKILKTTSYVAMVNSTNIDPDFTFSEKKSKYGYGVNINEEEPIKYIGHGGRGLGFVSLKIYVPAKKLNLIILENTYDRNTDIVYFFEKNIRRIVMNSSLVK